MIAATPSALPSPLRSATDAMRPNRNVTTRVFRSFQEEHEADRDQTSVAFVFAEDDKLQTRLARGKLEERVFPAARTPIRQLERRRCGPARRLLAAQRPVIAVEALSPHLH